VEKYTYEVCPFEKASQKDGASSTSLGTWAGFEEVESKMAFKNGQGCWQGPSRTMTVSVCCDTLALTGSHGAVLSILHV
jgi:protein kinase C substrate 80K-H